MSLHQLVTGLAILPLAGLTTATVSASANDFCLVGGVGTSEQNINCSSRWVAADGTRLGPVADPRLTPKTPYTTAGKVWSGSSGSTAVYSSGGVHVRSKQPQPVWQPPTTRYQGSSARYVGNQVYGSGQVFQNSHRTIAQATPTPSVDQVLVTRGANNHMIYTGMGGHPNWIAPEPAPPMQAPVVSCGSYNAGCGHGSGQHTYSSHNITSGCFTHGPGGQAQPVPCPATISSSNVWQTSSQTSNWPVTVIQHRQPPAPLPPIVDTRSYEHNSRFYNSLTGGVGGTPNTYYGGGGGVFISGGRASVLSQAPILRMRQKNKGGGGHKPKKNGHGCNPCGGGHH